MAHMKRRIVTILKDDNIADEEKIIQLLSALPRVEAPGDFGFRVKAGIAEGKPSAGSSLWLPTVAKAALPLMLLVLIGGYFAVTALYTTSEVPTTIVASRDEPAAPAEDQSPMRSPETAVEQTSTPVMTAQAPEASVNEQPVLAMPARTVAVSQPSMKRRVPNSAAPDDRSRSTDSAALIPKVLSKTNDPAITPETLPKGERAGEVLTRIGVNALFGESGWKAESVTPNTTAAKAGVKAGDVIESVDDQTLTDLGSVAKPAKGKKLRVLREGKSIDIVIDP